MKKEDFSIFLLAASLLGNMLVSKGVVRGGDGVIQAGKGTNRAGQDC